MWSIQEITQYSEVKWSQTRMACRWCNHGATLTMTLHVQPHPYLQLVCPAAHKHDDRNDGKKYSALHRTGLLLTKQLKVFTLMTLMFPELVHSVQYNHQKLQTHNIQRAAYISSSRLTVEVFY